MKVLYDIISVYKREIFVYPLIDLASYCFLSLCFAIAHRDCTHTIKPRDTRAVDVHCHPQQFSQE